MIRQSLLLTLLSTFCATAQEKITYADHVRPILENRCLNCHSADKKKGGLDLSTFGATMAGGSGGVNIEPGDAEASQFYKVIAHTAEPFMPPKSDKLPDAELAIIAGWIKGGVLETSGSAAKVKKKAEFGMKAGADAGKPDGPPAMPEHLLLDPVVAAPRPNAVTAMAHSPWAPLIAIAAPRQVLLYHTGTMELLGILPFPDGGIPDSVTFSRNGALVVAGGGIAGKKGIVAAWDVKTGKRVITVGEETDSVLAADITPDYKYIALGGPARRVRIYDTASGQKLHDIKKHTDWVTSVAFSPDGVLLATGDRNGGFYVWETATGGEFYNLKGHDKRITAAAWRADSNVVASASEDGNFILWEMQNGGQVKKTASHGSVLGANFGPDGSMVTCGRDGHVRVWDPAGKQVRDWVPDGGTMILRALFDHEGKKIITGAWNGEIHIWDAAKDAPALGALIHNPPALATRVDAAAKEVEAKNAAVAAAKAAVEEKEKLAAAAQAEMEAMKKSIADAQVQITATQKNLESIKAEMTKMSATRDAFASGMDAAKKQLAELTAPAPAPASGTPMPDNVQMALKNASEAEQSLNALTKSVLESKLTALQNNLTKYDAQLTAHQARMAAGDKEIAALNAAVEKTNKELPAREKAMQEALAAAAALKPAIDTALAAMAAPQATLKKWQAALENKAVITLREEFATIKEKVEDLKAELPLLDTEVTTLTTQVKATPPPPAEQLPTLQKKLEETQKRAEEVKKELAETEPQLSARDKAIADAWAKYLAMLPQPAPAPAPAPAPPAPAAAPAK